MSFSCKAPLNPLDGEVDLTFNESFTAAEGTRKTDVGTNGICKVDRSRESPVRWFWLWHRTRLNWFYMKWRGLAYILMMFGIALAAMMQRVQLNAIILILLLLPAPLIYARQISHFFGMLRNAKIRKLGPLEFDQGAPTPEITAMVQQQAQENQKFIELNRFFVVRTKHLLIMLTRANGNRMKLAEFRQSALNIDVPAENVDQTIAALVAAQCAQMDGENIVATPLGQAYVQRGIQLL